MKYRSVARDIAAALLLGIAVLGTGFYLMFLRPLEQWQSGLRSTLGRSEAEVVRDVGTSKYSILKDSNLEAELAGYMPIPTFPVRNKILVYTHLNYRGYLFVNSEG